MASLEPLERSFREQLERVELIAEITITPETAENLGAIIAHLAATYGPLEAIRLMGRHYPASMVVFLVAQGMFGYRDGNYWSSVASIIKIDKIDANLAQHWGRIFEEIMRSWGKPLFPSLAGRRYVDPILLHGGIPDYCLPDFFEHLLIAALNRPELALLDSDELIDEWLSSGSGRYLTDKPVLRFLEHGGTIAADFVARCVDMRRRHLETGSVPAASEVGLPARVVERYAAWIAERGPMASTRSASTRLIRPQIWLDPDGDGIMFDLPSQHLPAGDIGPQVTWRLAAGEITSQYQVHSWRRSGSWETEPQRLPLDVIAEEYVVSLDDDREVNRQWRFAGISATAPLLAFDAHDGRLVSWRGSLPNREVWLVYKAGVPITIPGGQLRERIDYLPGGWSGYMADCWDLRRAGNVQIAGKTIPIEPDPTAMRPRLVEGNLYATLTTGTQPAIYVGEPPNILIPLAPQADGEPESERWHITIRDNQGSAVLSSSLSDVKYAVTHRAGAMHISLANLGLTSTTFGTFTVRMRGPLGRDASFQIGLVPRLHIGGHMQVRVPDERGRYANVDLVVEAGQLRVTCDEAGVQTISPQPGRTVVMIPADRTQVSFRLERNDASVPITLGLPVVRWSLGDAQNSYDDGSRLVSRSVAWLDQVSSPRLTVSIVPPQATTALDARLHVYHRPNAQPQIVKARGGSKQHWMQFHLADAADSVRASQEPSALYELELSSLPGYAEPVCLPVLRVTKGLDVEQFTCHGMYRGNECLVMAKWRGGRNLRHRRVLLWPLWRPWVGPVTLAIPDSCSEEQRWMLDIGALPPGAYRAELAVGDPWSSRESERPFECGRHTVDINLGQRSEYFAYRRRQPECLTAQLEAILATVNDELLAERLIHLVRPTTKEEGIALLATFLTLCQDESHADQLLNETWPALVIFRRLCAPLQLLNALLDYANRIDRRGQILLEDALQYLAPQVGTLFFRGMRNRTISADELRRVVGAIADEQQATLVALFDQAGIRVREVGEHDTDSVERVLSTLNELYETVPEILITDSVRMYLREIGQFALLTAEQEQALGRAMADGSAAAEELARTSDTVHLRALHRRIEAGKAARDALINANLRLVVSIAKKYMYLMSLQDCIQEGNLGLLTAVEHFDFSRGIKFSTYATWWIRQAITRGVADKARVIRLPVHMVESLNRMHRARSTFTNDHGREPSDLELAETLDVPVEKVRHWLTIAQDMMSLETPVGEEHDTMLGDLIEAPDEMSVAELIDQKQLEEEINLVLEGLTERERRVLMLRFGIEDGNERTLEEVGREFGVTRERIRQIEVKALRRLQHRRVKARLKDHLFWN